MGLFGGDEDRGQPHVPDVEPEPAELWISDDPGDVGTGRQAEWGPGDPHGPGTGRGARPGRNRWIALAVGFVVLLAVVAVQHYAGGHPTASTAIESSSPAPTPTGQTSPTPRSTGSAAEPSRSRGPVLASGLVGVPLESAAASLSSAGMGVVMGTDETGEPGGPIGSRLIIRPVPDTTSPVTSTVPDSSLTDAGDWELVGYGQQGLVRYRPSTGRVVVTPMADVTDNGPPTFAVTATSAFVGSPGGSAQYVVPNGRPAGVVTGLDEPIQTVLPGPDPDHVWGVTSDGTTGSLVLLDSFGGWTGTVVPIPATLGGSAWYRVTPDGAGYVLSSGVGGTYDVRPDGITLVTHGQVLAAGPTALLVYECDEHAVCGSVLIDRDTETRRPGPPVDPSTFGFPVQGVISPDGRFAAMLGVSKIVLFDLQAGTQRAVASLSNFSVGNDASTMFTFTPDSRYLLIASQTGTVFAADTAAATATDRSGGTKLDALPIPPVVVLAIRPAT